MDDLKFNIYAFVDPQTPEEFAALVEEALRVFEELNESVAYLEDKLSRAATSRSPRR
jgi:hypothetical protein